jgi:hypothetical protein
MDQTFLLFFCGCVGFMSGYGVREMISQRRRREVRKIREEAERLLEMRAARRTQSDILGACGSAPAITVGP